MWTIWQDSPDCGCDDRPSFKWYARRSIDGHIVQALGPFATREDAERETGAAP
jgi:hypothetical protein